MYSISALKKSKERHCRSCLSSRTPRSHHGSLDVIFPVFAFKLRGPYYRRVASTPYLRMDWRLPSEFSLLVTP
jgi:hypothetical protein